MKDKLTDIMEELFHIYSPIHEEHELSRFAAGFLFGCGWRVSTDDKLNVTAIRGTGTELPLLNAHMDTWQKPSDKPYLPMVRYDPSSDRFSQGNVQIGGDDKAGMAIILYLAKYTELEFKILLTVEEEKVQDGVKNIPPEFYGDVCWALSLDRRGSSDIITEYRGRTLCGKGFADELVNMASENGYDMHVELSDRMADTYHIAEHCTAANLSVGFYGAHQENDYVEVSETYKVMKFVEYCIRHKERHIKPVRGGC